MCSFLLILALVLASFAQGDLENMRSNQNKTDAKSFESGSDIDYKRGFRSSDSGSGFANSSEISGSESKDISNLQNYTSRKMFLILIQAMFVDFIVLYA